MHFFLLLCSEWWSRYRRENNAYRGHNFDYSFDVISLCPAIDELPRCSSEELK